MLDAIKGAVEGAAEAVSDAADAVKETVKDAGVAAVLKVAEAEIKKHTDMDIEVDTDDIPDNWKEWVMKTGTNSLCAPSTWSFMADNEWNKRKNENWVKRGIKKIVMRVKDEAEVEDEDRWIVCTADWTPDSDMFYITWYPRAKNWKSDGTWLEESGRRYWLIGNQIEFGLQIYQLPGKCFYKSDWLDGFDDIDPEGMFPSSKKKVKRWFQFRHWALFWYSKAMWGWNYQWSSSPPENEDGTTFDFPGSVLSLPSMPDFKAPEIKLPQLPDVSLPDVSMPDVSMPDAPSISAPSAPSIDIGSFSMPDKKERPKSKWACHGIIELDGLHAKVSGKKLILSNANITNFWQEGHSIKDEKEDKQRFELECSDAEQAQSWLETLMASGVKEGEVGGCCTVA